MRGRRGSLAGAVALCLVLTACGGGGAADVGSAPGSGGGAGASPAEQVYADLNGRGAAGRDAAPAPAKQEGELSLYTSMNEDVAAAVTKAFTEKYGITVDVFRGSSETVLQRALQEGKAGRTGADVVETNFVEMQTLAGEGQLGEYAGPALADLPQIARFDRWTADRYNVFLPAWNTNLIKPGEEPRTWEALADPVYKGRMQIELTDYDWFENLTKYWVDHGKSQAEVDRLWQGIVANARTAKGHAPMIEALAAGQTAVDAMNYTFESVLKQRDGAPVAYKGAGGTTSVPAFPRPNGIGVVAAAPHPDAAWLFTDWLLSDGQEVLAAHDQTPVAKVAGDTALDGVPLVRFDVETLSKDGAVWAQKYDQLLRGVAAAPAN
jgi:iron(III) transport system substrate-binding protein